MIVEGKEARVTLSHWSTGVATTKTLLPSEVISIEGEETVVITIAMTAVSSKVKDIFANEGTRVAMDSKWGVSRGGLLFPPVNTQ